MTKGNNTKADIIGTFTTIANNPASSFEAGHFHLQDYCPPAAHSRGTGDGRLCRTPLLRLMTFAGTCTKICLRLNSMILNMKCTRYPVAALTLVMVLLSPIISHAQRVDVSLDMGWQTIANDSNKNAHDGFESAGFSDQNWVKVNVPHNWDSYHGYRRLRHGNRHGYAWYRKKFTAKKAPGKRYFLFFEGVGSYATVWLNGKQVGYHAGGRTTFTLDVTDVITFDKSNLLAVRADHPENIRDLPWVCGGCSDERGFSEGSQPMGIFRPVHLLITDPVRIEPFGVHIWNDSTATTKNARLYIQTEVKNYGVVSQQISVRSQLIDKTGKVVFTHTNSSRLQPGAVALLRHEPSVVNNPNLWSVENPYLYKLVSTVAVNGRLTDRVETPYGIRTISWPIGKPVSSNQFLLNGKPVFINGIAEYEHLLGSSHAFTDAQIKTRVAQMKAAGFNSFRDAHHPHNLRYQDYWDSLGFLWWTQMGAHVWFDNPAFRSNFKSLLTEWVKERRNSPSVVLWGLQNESKIPEDFARECTELIRKLDPTTSSQRLVTTCNGGTGTDWDVPQNWTGTYGGDPQTYSQDVKRQILIGEYGAWRTLDLHTEGGFVQNGPYSEDRMTELMETKVRLAEAVKDSTAGHYMWLLTSHDNPGRVQAGEGYRELDRLGPVNYKGLLTPWEEPLDVYYMYRANYAPKTTAPMVYIASHTWPDRWIKPGLKDSIKVYSNCDEVELFNDVKTISLGRKKRGGTGTHFQWDGVQVNYNVLYAVGYVNGKAVAEDYIVLNHLPQPGTFSRLYKRVQPITAPQKGYNYLYRVNCGGPDYTDAAGNTWLADRAKTTNSWGSESWTADYKGMPAFFASQRSTNDPINNTADWKLFQSFRFGRDKLRFNFPVPDGEYLVELYFTEPWLGTGGGMDCTGWRLFDVAINNNTVIRNLDIFKEAGHDGALKKTVKASIRGGELVISFPRVPSGQAIISAIAIASLTKQLVAAPSATSIISKLRQPGKPGSNWNVRSWMNTGDRQYVDKDVLFSALPANMHGAEWLQVPAAGNAAGDTIAFFTVTANAEVYVAVPAGNKLGWLSGYEDTHTNLANNAGENFNVWKKRYSAGESVVLGAAGLDKNAGKGYTVAVSPASAIEPPYDLKPVMSYKAINAKLSGPGVVKGQIDGKDRVIFREPSAANRIDWEITTGVGDTYSLTIAYNNPGTTDISGKLEFFSADGTLMKEEIITFTPTRPGKSNYISTTTGSMINAGTYRLRITSPTAKGLNFNSLDVQ